MFSFITFSKCLLLWTFSTGFYCASIINGHVYSTERSFNDENKTPQQGIEKDVAISDASRHHGERGGKPTPDLVESDNISGWLANVIEKFNSAVVPAIVLLAAIPYFFVSLYVVYKSRAILNWFSKSEKEITDYNPQTPMATWPKGLSSDNTNAKSLKEPTFFDATDPIQSLLRSTSTERPIGVTAFQDGNLDLNCGGKISLLSLAGPVGSDKSDLNQDAALAWSSNDPHTGAPAWIVAVADGVTSSRSSELGSKFVVHEALNLVLKGYDDNIPEEQLGEFVFREIQKKFLWVGEELKKHPLKYMPSNEYEATWKRNIKKGTLLQTTLALAWAKDDRFYYASLGDSGLVLYSDGANPRLRLKDCDLDTNKVEAFGPNGGYHKTLLQTDTVKLNEPCVLILCTDGILRGFKNDLSFLQNCDIRKQLLNLCEGNSKGKEFDDNLTVVKVAFTPIIRRRS